ncbi:hypothetical protein SADUNF_Sadunf16G0161900 [Salix dunnii]|uniref:Uncharacterized protein n=1 Tax=Salix dunnii TaxID=1413687 RepID=A0A835J8X9_9ROSI|nr:hypothetical protein SADUNF_Sadunf16G0161900 [Salix dunnii]
MPNMSSPDHHRDISVNNVHGKSFGSVITLSFGYEECRNSIMDSITLAEPAASPDIQTPGSYKATNVVQQGI